METHYPFASYRIEKGIKRFSSADQKAVREAYASLGYSGAISVITAIKQREDGDPKSTRG